MCIRDSDWSVHSWTAHDNPYVAKQWQEELDEIERDRPLFKETPLFKQWYLNQWVVDTDKLVYKFNSDRNIYDTLPKYPNGGEWTYVLGVDTGWEDDNAFVLSAFHPNDPNLYIVETFNKPHMYFDHDDASVSVVKTIQAFMNRYPISKVVIDGANKQGVETMRMRSSIPFEYADKQGKNDYIEMMNGDLIQGKIKLHRSCSSYANEMMGLVWRTDGDKVIVPRKEHPALSNHLCDAGLYGWRNGYHYYFKAIAPVKKMTDQDHADLLLSHHIEKLQKERDNKDNQQYGGWTTDNNGIADWQKWGD